MKEIEKQQVNFDNTIYTFAKNIQHNDALRNSFNQLSKSAFGLNLEPWYLEGYWQDQYIPYSLLHENKVISNISITKIDFDILGDKKTGAQLGTVMTDDAYRHKGLNKYIMEKVLSEWKEKVDFIYLFANDTVLNFYPKFDFEQVEEYEFSKVVEIHHNNPSAQKMDMENIEQRAMLIENIKSALPISKIAAPNNLPLMMFYCQSFKKENIYFIENLNAIVIADFYGDMLYINDIISKEPIHLDDVINVLASNHIKKVTLGFTPLNEKGYDKNLAKGAGRDTLFVLKENADLFKGKEWAFPVMSHA